MSDGKRVLVVEDSPTTRARIARALEDAGYEVMLAEDGEQAIAAVREHHPELVVLDIVLPKKNGYQVCRTIKSDPELAIKVLIVTAKDQEKDRIWSGRQGADRHLSKPIDMDLFLSTVRDLVPLSVTAMPAPKTQDHRQTAQTPAYLPH